MEFSKPINRTKKREFSYLPEINKNVLCFPKHLLIGTRFIGMFENKYEGRFGSISDVVLIGGILIG
ncbi:hypothetical protein [Candidatus Lokiarchaeum ossiferum]